MNEDKPKPNPYFYKLVGVLNACSAKHGGCCNCQKCSKCVRWWDRVVCAIHHRIKRGVYKSLVADFTKIML